MTYLLRHPDAKDTIDGILDWWLPGGRGGNSRSGLETALEDMVGRGWVNLERRAPDVVLYGLNKTKAAEILEHLVNHN